MLVSVYDGSIVYVSEASFEKKLLIYTSLIHSSSQLVLISEYQMFDKIYERLSQIYLWTKEKRFNLYMNPLT